MISPVFKLPQQTRPLELTSIQSCLFELGIIVDLYLLIICLVTQLSTIVIFFGLETLKIKYVILFKSLFQNKMMGLVWKL